MRIVAVPKDVSVRECTLSYVSTFRQDGVPRRERGVDLRDARGQRARDRQNGGVLALRIVVLHRGEAGLQVLQVVREKPGRIFADRGDTGFGAVHGLLGGLLLITAGG